MGLMERFFGQTKTQGNDGVVWLGQPKDTDTVTLLRVDYDKLLGNQKKPRKRHGIRAGANFRDMVKTINGENE